jgi:hypothetical protein
MPEFTRIELQLRSKANIDIDIYQTSITDSTTLRQILNIKSLNIYLDSTLMNPSFADNTIADRPQRGIAIIMNNNRSNSISTINMTQACEDFYNPLATDPTNTIGIKATFKLDTTNPNLGKVYTISTFTEAAVNTNPTDGPPSPSNEPATPITGQPTGTTNDSQSDDDTNQKINDLKQANKRLKLQKLNKLKQENAKLQQQLDNLNLDQLSSNDDNDQNSRSNQPNAEQPPNRSPANRNRSTRLPNDPTNTDDLPTNPTVPTNSTEPITPTILPINDETNAELSSDDDTEMPPLKPAQPSKTTKTKGTKQRKAHSANHKHHDHKKPSPKGTSTDDDPNDGINSIALTNRDKRSRTNINKMRPSRISHAPNNSRNREILRLLKRVLRQKVTKSNEYLSTSSRLTTDIYSTWKGEMIILSSSRTYKIPELEIMGLTSPDPDYLNLARMIFYIHSTSERSPLRTGRQDNCILGYCCPLYFMTSLGQQQSNDYFRRTIHKVIFCIDRILQNMNNPK